MNRAGVTLIELVVAITVTATLFAAGYAALGTALDRREAAVELLEADLRAATIRTSLESWLAGARVAAESSRPVFSGADGEYEGVPDDEIVFLTAAPSPLGRGQVTVRLYVDRDPETPQSGLVADFGAWLGSRRTRVELAPEVVGLDARYRSRLLGGRPWHASWISSSVMPAGVEVTLLGPGDGSLHPLLALPLRLAFQGGR